AVLDLDAGTERIVATSDVQLNFAEGSPDGRTIALIESLCSRRYVAAGDLVLIDAATGARRTVDAGAVDVSCARWTDDGIFAMGLESMDAVALEVATPAGDVREVWRTAGGVGGYQPAGAPLPGGGFVIGTSAA